MLRRMSDKRATAAHPAPSSTLGTNRGAKGSSPAPAALVEKLAFQIVFSHRKHSAHFKMCVPLWATERIRERCTIRLIPIVLLEFDCTEPRESVPNHFRGKLGCDCALARLESVIEVTEGRVNNQF